MLRRVLVLVLLGVLCHKESTAAEIAVPPALEPWREWVLQDEQHRRCPFLASAPATEKDSFRCAWPERLMLSLDTQGGTFEQRWQVFAESWVRLPGSAENWPRDVRVNGQPGAVVSRDGAPSLRLVPGTHGIAGRLSWTTRPEALPIDTRTAIVDLTLDGSRVAQPERPDGSVWLGKRRSADQPERMEIQVYRLLQDEVPARLLTRIRLQVSGEGREELLARVLPDAFVPLSLVSSLPARLESDGRLRVQVRPGSWEITLIARGDDVATQISRPATDGLWATDEVWSFAGEDRLRVAAAQGAEGIDPAQANVPFEWQQYPAFRIPPEGSLSVTERGRGLQNADHNRLTLFRRIWLDFDHRGLTAIDTVRGDMRRDWRLEMVGPFRLENASLGRETLLVTQNPDGEGAGVELRSPTLNLSAVSRVDRSRGALPATGWSTRFESVTGELNLPPGHRLIAAVGADRAPDAWLDSWGLWDLFGVLVVAVFAGWLAGRPVGVVAFLGLLLMFHESPLYIWLWANAIGAAAVARAAPEGRFLRFARGYRLVSFGVLAVALLPFFWTQGRIALHPQLEDYYSAQFDYSGGEVEEVVISEPSLSDRLRRLQGPASAEVDEAVAEAVPAPAPAPPAAGLNVAQVVQRYAPGTLLQTGPGVPRWQYQRYNYGWSGPVEPDQTVRFLYIGPILMAVWRFAGIALLAALFVALLQAGGSGKWDWRQTGHAVRGWLARPRSAPAAALAIALFASPFVKAAETPDPALLTELKSRLLRAPDCVPACADITSARVTARGDRLEVEMRVSALANVAVAVPSANDRWQLDMVTINGRSALAIAREGDGTLWIPVSQGAHDVRLAGSLARAESIQLSFPSTPRSISVSSDGWDVSGVNEGRLLAGSLELVRRRSSTDSGTLESSGEFPAFVRVTREFDLGLDWSLQTRVDRIAPDKAAVNVEVPLVAAESVLSDAVEVRERPDVGRVALVGLERGQERAGWASGLPRSETLQLSLPANTARTETWRFTVSPQWNVAFEGLPAVLPANLGAVWTYEFHPRPGETLTLRVTRPVRAEGGTLAIDSVDHRVNVGQRSRSASLSFNYRSTQGGRHIISLPAEARVTSVSLDGQPVQLRPDDGELSIGLLPGAHAVEVRWTEPLGAGWRIRPSSVDLRASASNVTTTLQLPERRWPLFAMGPGVGPAILYWAELIVFVLTAVVLGRWAQSPLRTHEWLLLGLGLSTLSWLVLAIVALWLFAMQWRRKWEGKVTRVRFNTVQVALAALTVIAVAALVFSGVRQSLLASPDMGIAGPGSGYGTFTWFLDKTVSALPQPQVFSVPMWVYRAFMFAWALWIVVALLRWLRASWHAWRANGIWRGKTLATPA